MKKILTFILICGFLAVCICAVMHWGFMGIIAASCLYGLVVNIIPDNTKVGE